MSNARKSRRSKISDNDESFCDDDFLPCKKSKSKTNTPEVLINADNKIKATRSLKSKSVLSEEDRKFEEDLEKAILESNPEMWLSDDGTTPVNSQVSNFSGDSEHQVLSNNNNKINTQKRTNTKQNKNMKSPIVSDVIQNQTTNSLNNQLSNNNINNSNSNSNNNSDIPTVAQFERLIYNEKSPTRPLYEKLDYNPDSPSKVHLKNLIYSPTDSKEATLDNCPFENSDKPMKSSINMKFSTSISAKNNFISPQIKNRSKLLPIPKTSCSAPNLSTLNSPALRVGLSRNKKVKPLHPAFKKPPT